jgi:DNA-binding beta-propeller fold protein YncE
VSHAFTSRPGAPRHRSRRIATIVAASALCVGAAASAPAALAQPPTFTYDLVEIATFDSGSGEAGAEIVAFDDVNGLVLVTNGAEDRIDIFDPAAPSALAGSVDLSGFGSGVQSVAVHGGLAVAVVAGATVVDPGSAVFFDPADPSASTSAVGVGALPDMVTFTPDGRWVLVANEGEPRCAGVTDPEDATNPEGSVSMIDVSSGVPGAVRTAGFSEFNDDRDALEQAGVRLNWPAATVAQDLEPEYITVDKRSRTAWVTLQENNALAVVDIRAGEVSDIVPLGLKDHEAAGNELDASDRDNAANGQPNDDPKFASWPVHGMYMPDGLDSWDRRGSSYLVTANEGDGREYFDNLANEAGGAELCFTDETRVKDLTLGSPLSGVPDLAEDENLGRLKVSRTALSEFDGDEPPTGDTDPEDVEGLEYTKLASFGARSVTIWTPDGRVVWDSGSTLGRTVAAQDPDGWVRGPGEDEPAWATAFYDTRSDDKGVEPESVVHGKAYGRDLLFVGLERAGGIVTFDATNPSAPVLQGWTTTAGAISPEGIAFVSDEQSPTGRPLVLVAHEISGTTVAYEVVKKRA